MILYVELGTKTAYCKKKESPGVGGRSLLHICTERTNMTHWWLVTSLTLSFRQKDMRYPPIVQSEKSFNIYRVSQEEWTKLWEGLPYVKLYRYNPKHLYPKLNGYGDNGQRSLKL